MSKNNMKQKNTLSQNGKEYWRSLDQLADTPEFKEFVQREFPEQASEMTNPVTRRTFLSLMGASIAMAGLASCRRPVEKIIPYVIKPEEIVPGVAEYFATSMPFGTGAFGVIAKSHEGRPTKVEGNAMHSSSMGAANAFVQASLLGLYDPDRSKVVMQGGAQKNWDDFVNTWKELFKNYSANKGEGLAVLSESFASPTLARLQKDFAKVFSKATWVTYESVSDENAFNGHKAATGKDLTPAYDYSKAKVILSLDADFLNGEDIQAARGFMDARKVSDEKSEMNRLYMVESVFSLTGGMADHRLRLQSRQIGAFTVAVAKALGVDTMSWNADTSAFDSKWIDAVAKDLKRAGKNSMIIAGRRQPASVHALVLAINSALGNVGTTINYREIKDTSVSDRNALVTLTGAMNSGTVSTLVILGGNPVYNAPADLKFSEALGKVKNTIHLSGYFDETSKAASWHLPQAHYLESWGDTRATDGTIGVIQPLIEPLYLGHSAVELMYLITTGKEGRGYDIVRETWKDAFGKGANFEKSWRLVLHDGVLDKSSTPLASIKLDNKKVAEFASKNPMASGTADANDMEIVFTQSASLFDGRFANNGWLQELPDPVTKICWDNVALMSHTTAKALGIKNGLKDGKNYQPIVKLQYNGREMEIPAWIQPGYADYSVAVAVGYGRTFSGRVGDKVGSNTYTIRTAAAMDFDKGLKISKTNDTYLIATVQDHGGFDTDALADSEIQKRVPSILKEGTLEEFQKNPHFVHEEKSEGEKVLFGKDGQPISIVNPHVYDKGYQWGMTIDLNACTGCNVCMIACQSENNIAVVGKKEVANGREMSWIRLDRYYLGDMDMPEMKMQPVACQHCENAPCEQVCPVAATVHDSEGLNVMVYNRCVGTRYCANNCPYKVRRFNFLEFQPETSGFYGSTAPESLKMAKNPDVTVRMRGVMEKCTYCVQRISGARITAKKENREIKDGEVVTACQQACPTGAIVFGNINDPNSKIATMKKNSRGYDLLGEINTRPRTSYLAKLTNPNPELVSEKKA